MGAISIAFDIIIVGALALPWVLLVIHLFFSNDESSLRTLLAWVNKQNQPAVAGALLFAMTYSLGSAVSRIAQDFFDDDDLHIRVSKYLLRVGISESSIRSDVYCAIPKKLTANPQTADPKADSAAAEKREPFRNKDAVCEFAAKWVIPRGDGFVSADWIDELEERTGDIFRLKEATVLLEGTDKIEVLRQFHDQIMVLRGAAFSGMLAFSFCLFWWSAQFQSVLRWLVLVIYVFPGVVATWNHFTDHPHSPPYMEFTLLALAAASACLLWQTRHKSRRVPGVAATTGRGRIRLSYVALSLFLTAAAFLGWWATQVLYDQQVIYSYQALSSALPQATTPNPK